MISWAPPSPFFALRCTCGARGNGAITASLQRFMCPRCGTQYEVMPGAVAMVVRPHHNEPYAKLWVPPDPGSVTLNIAAPVANRLIEPKGPEMTETIEERAIKTIRATLTANDAQFEAALVITTANLATDLGCDSLDGVEIVMALEEEFDIEISDSDHAEIQTVGDLVKLVTEITGGVVGA